MVAVALRIGSPCDAEKLLQLGDWHKQYPVTYRSIKERTFVEDLSAAGKVGVYADVPLMFPPPEIEGKILAGGVLPKGRQYSHPAGLPDELEKAGVPWVINGMSWTTFRNRPGPYLDEALEITGKRIRATEWLMDNSDWDLMANAIALDVLYMVLAAIGFLFSFRSARREGQLLRTGE